ncbi:unnamed protein product [Rhodiola kirilowii]
MNRQHVDNQFGPNHDEYIVPGFELPPSPPSCYDNTYLPDNQLSEPPVLHFQLPQTLLNSPAIGNLCESETESHLQPQNPTVNHLYLENKNTPRNVVTLGATYRFRSKFVTVVYYRTVPQMGSASRR